MANSQPERTALAILGPTAIGKTALAMAIADATSARLISVDSAMVFKHMNIGTAKPDAAELAAYPHALVDVLEPTETYSAADFLRDARVELEAAWAADELPVFVGGTMLYFRALRDGLASMPERDNATRLALVAQAGRDGWGALFEELRQVDPAAAERIDPHNQQRLIRALEVWRLTGTPISVFWQTPQQGLLPELGGQLLEHALVPTDRAELHKRINGRFEQMLADGFVDEVRGLHARGDLDLDMPSMRCVGYRQIWHHVAGEVSIERATEQSQAATRQLAKRQLTWLRGWSRSNLIQEWRCSGDPRVHLGQLLRTL